MSTLAEIHTAIAERQTTLTAEAAKLGISRWALSSAMRNEGLPTLKRATDPREFSALRRCTARGWPPVTGDLKAWNKQIRPGRRCHGDVPAAEEDSAADATRPSASRGALEAGWSAWRRPR